MIKINIPKWGMPREDIPIGVFCEKDPNITAFNLVIPNELVLKDIWNTNFTEIPTPNKLNKVNIPISCIKTSSKTKKIYFGFVVATKDITREIETQFPIKIIVIKAKKEISNTSFVKIYRPKLQVIPPSSPIVLTDKGSSLISLGFKYQGFGHVKISLQVTTQEGVLISTTTSLEDAIIHDLYMAGYFGKTELDKEDIGSIKLKNEKELVSKVADLLQTISKNKHGGDLTVAVKKWLETVPLESIGEKLTPMIHSLINNFVKYNPTENMSIDDTTIHIPNTHKLKMPIKRLKHIVKYEDNLENTYEPIEFWVDVDDRRSHFGLIEVKMGKHMWDEKKIKNLRRKRNEEKEK